jgi:hypothetical protein
MARPAIIASTLVLPAPEGPTMAVICAEVSNAASMENPPGQQWTH